jgi:hypothetical protein
MKGIKLLEKPKENGSLVELTKKSFPPHIKTYEEKRAEQDYDG